MRSTAAASCPTTLVEYVTAPEPTTVVVVVRGLMVLLLELVDGAAVVEASSTMVVDVESGDCDVVGSA